MAETPPPSGPLAGANGTELRELQQFLLYLGSALTAAGEAVNRVEEHLHRVPRRTAPRGGKWRAGSWPFLVGEVLLGRHGLPLGGGRA
jgi:hypothetical protein